MKFHIVIFIIFSIISIKIDANLDGFYGTILNHNGADVLDVKIEGSSKAIPYNKAGAIILLTPSGTKRYVKNPDPNRVYFCLLYTSPSPRD